MAKLFNLFSKRSNQPKPVLSGAQLVSDFTSAINNLTTAETAKYVAEQTEQATIDTLRTVGEQSAAGQPVSMTPDQQAELVRASLDAHMQKAQSEQINDFTDQQLLDVGEQDKQNYIGKKIKVRVIDAGFEPIESVWQDKHTGQTRKGKIKTKTIKGIIEDLSLEKNAIALRPALKSRLLLPDRKAFFVYVINPATLQPAVEISLI